MTESVPEKTEIPLFKDRQFYWWIGHVIVTLNGLFYFSSVLSLNSNTSYYQRAYLGALVSYAIVIYNSIGMRYTTLDINLLCDENVHYFVIALYWYSNQPIAVTLIPFFVFSVFHTLSYFRTNLLPLIPIQQQQITSSDEKETHLILLIDSKLKHFTDTYHMSAMYYVAYFEVIGILGRIIAGIITLQTSVLALIVYIHFLRLRYYLSDYTKEAIQNTTVHLDKWLLLPSSTDTTPTKPSSRHATTALTVVSNIYLSMKRLIIRYGSIQPSSSSSS